VKLHSVSSLGLSGLGTSQLQGGPDEQRGEELSGKKRVDQNVATTLCLSILLALTAPWCVRGFRTVPPGGTFRLANHALIDVVRIKNGPVHRVRFVGDGCDWRRSGKPRIPANISELDRVFRSFARIPLLVTTVRR